MKVHPSLAVIFISFVSSSLLSCLVSPTAPTLRPLNPGPTGPRSRAQLLLPWPRAPWPQAVDDENEADVMIGMFNDISLTMKMKMNEDDAKIHSMRNGDPWSKWCNIRISDDKNNGMVSTDGDVGTKPRGNWAWDQASQKLHNSVIVLNCF